MEEESVASPLLQEEKVYHPGCPGCANDRRKELQEGLPYKEFLYVWIISLATCKEFLCPPCAVHALVMYVSWSLGVV
jgi:hypothetical protein